MSTEKTQPPSLGVQPVVIGPDDFIGSHGKRFEEPTGRKGFTTIRVLECLKGKPWDAVALAFVSALNPGRIRVTKGECTLDASGQRVTVFLGDDDLIEWIEQEVSVWLPDGVMHGSALNAALKHGIDSPQVKFHDDDQISYYHGSSKVLKDGTTVPYPIS